MAFCAAASAAFLAGCGKAGDSGLADGDEVRSVKARLTGEISSKEDVATLSADNRHFALDLYRAERSQAGNLVLSPESISLALAMTYAGAAGNTAREMAATLRFSLPPERLHVAFDALDLALTGQAGATSAGPGTFQLELASSVWSQAGFSVLPSFLDVLAEDYGAGLHTVDFAHAPDPARQSINAWVSAHTQAKIPQLLDEGAIAPDTALVLANAVYFKADWRTPFDPGSRPGTFSTPNGPVSVPMMAGAAAFPAWSGPGYQAVSLPYAGDTTSMVLIVPDAGTFDAFEGALTDDVLDTILVTTGAGSMGVSMPRFHFQSHVSLAKTLLALGMKDAFDPEAADFSGIDGGHDLSVDNVIHEAVIAVDEKGTEAAASTAVVIRTKAAQQMMIVDRPFLFLVQDNATASTLFLGRVVDPSR